MGTSAGRFGGDWPGRLAWDFKRPSLCFDALGVWKAWSIPATGAEEWELVCPLSIVFCVGDNSTSSDTLEGRSRASFKLAEVEEGQRE